MRCPSLAGFLIAALTWATPSIAQTAGCSAVPAVPADSADAHWPPPLDRLVTLRPATIPLRTALDRVAASAGIRVSYSAEQLPLDRVVCLGAERLPAGRVLDALLRGAGVDVVAAGGDQIVLAPRRDAALTVPPAPAVSAMSTSVGMLERVLVTGSASGTGAPARELPVSVTVIDGEQLVRANTGTLAEALDTFVPGMWAWAQSPASLVGSYASIRGASSFGLSYPKVYIDGIEMANPLLLARFNPEAVDHIEVIRGPQGSALYGTDAISGVINIVTRHDGAALDGSRVELRSTAGLAQSDFPRGVLTQEHSLSYARGTSERSLDVQLDAGTMGAFVPNGSSRRLMTTASSRLVGATTSFGATARLFLDQAGAPNSPLVARPMRQALGQANSASNAQIRADDGSQSAREYTLGATTTTAITDRLTISFVGGVDGYRLANVQANFTPVPSALDSALRAAEGSATRGTFRMSGVYRWNGDAPNRATVTVAMEQAALRVSAFDFAHARVVNWQNSGGVSAQATVAVADAVFLTAGARLEHDSRLMNVRPFETLPMIGLAAVRELGPLAVKLRGAYGMGIRASSRMGDLQFQQARRFAGDGAPLGPERQAGTEIGIDLMLRRALTLQATRFDQRASGLIQQVAVAPDSPVLARRLSYAAQNVGEISNRGWELQSSANVSRLALSGAVTFVDSRVQHVAPGYAGDLAPGDRVLQVPARTAAFNIGWSAPRWHASLGGSRAFDWINYDALQLTNAVVAGTAPPHTLAGPTLRTFWRRYDGNLRLHAALSKTVRNGLAIEISGDNLLGYQTGEPDNVTVLPGRTILTGVRLRF
jgi:iron complex outermembrane receptor protein